MRMKNCFENSTLGGVRNLARKKSLRAKKACERLCGDMVLRYKGGSKLPHWSLAISGWPRCSRTGIIILQFSSLFLDNPVFIL
jgi:hypothetical protein